MSNRIKLPISGNRKTRPIDIPPIDETCPGIKEITRWETSDGEVHDTLEAAQDHLTNIHIRAEFRQLVSNFYYYGMDQEEVVDALMQNVPRIREILGA